jgi:hypothetical protein
MAINGSLDYLNIKPHGIHAGSLVATLAAPEENSIHGNFSSHIIFNATQAERHAGFPEHWKIQAKTYRPKITKYNPETRNNFKNRNALTAFQKNLVMYGLRDDYIKKLAYDGHYDEVDKIIQATGLINDRKQHHWSMQRLVTTNQIFVEEKYRHIDNADRKEGKLFEHLSINVNYYEPFMMREEYWESIKQSVLENGEELIAPMQFSAELTPACIDVENKIMMSAYHAGNQMKELLSNKETILENAAFVVPQDYYAIFAHFPFGKLYLTYANANEAVIFLHECEEEFIRPFEDADERLAEAEYKLIAEVPGFNPTHYSNLDPDHIDLFDRLKKPFSEEYFERFSDPDYNKKHSNSPKPDNLLRNGIRPLGLN